MLIRLDIDSSPFYSDFRCTKSCFYGEEKERKLGFQLISSARYERDHNNKRTLARRSTRSCNVLCASRQAKREKRLFCSPEENYAGHTFSFMHTHSNGNSKQISNRISGLCFFRVFIFVSYLSVGKCSYMYANV